MAQSLKLLFKLREASEISNIGVTKLYQYINDGSLQSVKVGRSRLIPRDALESFISNLPNDKTESDLENVPWDN